MKEFNIVILHGDTKGNVKDHNERLDDLGKKGWELVAVYDGCCFMQREILEMPEEPPRRGYY